jgi:hypothetical protein
MPSSPAMIQVSKSEAKIDLARFSILLAIAAGIVLKSTVMRKGATCKKFLGCCGNWFLHQVVQKVQINARGAVALIKLQKR